MNYKIALIKGDGIGPEVVNEAVGVMEAVGKKFGHTFEFVDVLLGGCATDAVGKSYPDGTAEKCKACDAVLLGAVGGPKWGSDKPAEQRPETALLAIRKDLGLYANLRPAALRPAMADACPLKKETAEKGIDLMMVRELTGGIYFGKRDKYQTEDRGLEATDLMAYSEKEIERIGRRAFELARLRRKKVSRRAGDQPPVAERYAPPGGGVLRRAVRGRAGGQLRHAAGEGPRPVRRGGHREHVRRHSL